MKSKKELTISVANPLTEKKKKELLEEIRELIQLKYYS